MTHARRITTLLAATVTALALPGVAGADSLVDVRVTEDGQRRVGTAFELVELEEEPVVEENVAFAYARCEQCEAYAISFQIVLAGEVEGEIAPKNYGVAVNEECTSCVTGAWARQWVRVGSGEPELTDEGEDRLESVAARIRMLERRPDLDLAGFEAEVEKLEAVVDDVLATELEWDD